MDNDTALFEALFLAWCPPYDPNRMPDYLRDDPVRAYGQFGFRSGLLLGLRLGLAASDV